MTENGRPRIGVFHPGAQHSGQTALAFQEAGQLAWYATSSDAGSWPLHLERIVPRPLRGRFHRDDGAHRGHSLDPALLRQIGRADWAETAARQLGATGFATRMKRRGRDQFTHGMQNLLQREPVDVLWGYDGHALEAFRWAKLAGIRCVLDQTSTHRKTKSRLLQEERDRHPEFFSVEDAPLDPSEIAVQDEELALADLVIVGSEFNRESLRENGCADEKIRIVPYGYDDTAFPAVLPPKVPLSGRRARFLFIGELAAPQGIAFLLKAFQAISADRATLTLIGAVHIPPITFARHAANVTHFPSLSRDAVIGQLFASDVFVFPSLFDDGDVSLYDALGAGLGIIQSANFDIPTVHGRNGIVLERLSVEMLTNAIEVALTPTERIAQWGRESWHMRAERSWNTYRRSIQRTAAAL